MDTTDQFYQNAVRFCEENSDPALIKKYSRFFVEGFDTYGVDNHKMLEQRKAWLMEYQPVLNRASSFELAERFMQTGKYELEFIALWLIKLNEKEYSPETFRMIGSWLEKYLINWAFSDTLSGDVLSYILEHHIVCLDEYRAWMVSESRWKRRAAAVGLIKPVKHGMDVQTALEMIRPAMLDKERVVHQALGWFLREAWKLHPEVVEPFLSEYKNSCARLIIQYATEKMTVEQKGRYKRSGNSEQRTGNGN
jgi:3-methyladenine DNA glycosylase AlkD